MGNQPTKLDDETKLALQSEVDDACLKAAKALKEGDMLLVCIGDGISTVGAPTEKGLVWDPKSNVERFYGVWGNVFNEVRKESLHKSLSIIDQWRKMYCGTEADQKIKEIIEGEVAATWKSHLLNSQLMTNSVSQENTIDLENHDGESDDEEMANLQFESFEPVETNAFYVFTSSQNGSAAKYWGHGAVRECRGSIQQWQCGSKEGPCRDQDVWEAPDGFSFMLSNREEDGELVAPSGFPRSRPPVFKVNMHDPVCMDRALSVAAAFRTNHPICRSCSGLARPAMPLIPGDCDWIDITERATKYSKWRRAVLQFATQDTPQENTSSKTITSTRKKLVVLEIGGSPSLMQSSFPSQNKAHQGEHHGEVGSSHLLWTTVRQESESVVGDLIRSEESCRNEVNATLIRINETYPLIDRKDRKGALLQEATISIILSPLQALQKIDDYLRQL